MDYRAGDGVEKCHEDMMADEGELSPKVLDSNRQMYKEMRSNLAVRDATEKRVS